MEVEAEENSVGALELVGCRVEVGVNGCEGVGAVGGWLTKYSGEALHSSVGWCIAAASQPLSNCTKHISSSTLFLLLLTVCFTQVAANQYDFQ